MDAENENPAGVQAEPGFNENFRNDHTGSDSENQGDFDEESEQYRREAEDAAEKERQQYAGADPAGQKDSPSFDLEKYRASRLLTAENLHIAWLFLNSLMVNTVGLIVGAAGVGKSQFLLQIICAIASKLNSMAGAFIPGIHGKVVYFAAEEDDRIIQRRLKAVIAAFSSSPEDQRLIEENLYIIPGAGQDWRFLENSKGNAVASAFFHQVIESLMAIGKIALVVFDPMTRFYGAEENDNSSATVFISNLEQIKEKLQTTVICVHHIGKNNAVTDESSLSKALHQDAARGASALTGAARWQLNIAPIPGKLAKSLGLGTGGDGRFIAGRVSKNNYAAPGRTFYLERAGGGVLFQADVSGTNEALERVLLAKTIEELVKIQADKQGSGKITKRGFSEVYASRWRKEIIGATQRSISQAIEAGLLSGELIDIEGLNSKKQKTIYLGVRQVKK